MFSKALLTVALLSSLVWGFTIPVEFNGNWHLRTIDGKDVRKARAIIELNMYKMRITGFDACNRMNGQMIREDKYRITVPSLKTTRMACRESIHSWVSYMLHGIFKEGFNITTEERRGVEGIIIKSPTHELFLKKMGEE